MRRIKKIKLKKENISNLNNAEMKDLKGAAATSPECIIYSVGCGGGGDHTKDFVCVSMALTTPCYTYPNC